MTLTKCKTAEDYRQFLAVYEIEGREKEVIDDILKTLDGAEDGIDERVDELEKEVKEAGDTIEEGANTTHNIGTLLCNMVDSITDKEEDYTLQNVKEALEYILDRFPDLIA